MSRDPIGERGGADLLAFVHNGAVNLSDRLGLESFPWSPGGVGFPSGPGWVIDYPTIRGPVQPREKCGENVDHLVDTLFNEVEHAFSKRHRTGWQKLQFCGCTLPLAYRFDVQLFLSTGYPPPSQSPCKQTFSYKGKCYWGGSLNYLLWGRVHGLCAREFPNRSQNLLSLAVSKAVAYKSALQILGILGGGNDDPAAPALYFLGIGAQAVKMTTCGFANTGRALPALETRCEPSTQRYPGGTDWHFAGVRDEAL